MIIDAAISKELKRNFDSLYRARVLVSIVISYFTIIAFIELWLLLIADISPNGKQLGSYICLFMQINYLMVLFTLRQKGWYFLAANYTIFITVLGVISGIAISGGPIQAPSVSMNILPILMAFVLIGKRGGLIWTQIILTLHVCFMVALSYNIQFPQLLSQASLPMQHMAHWLITYTAMIGLMIIYDTLNTRLKDERDAEKRKFEHLASHDPLTDLANRLQFDINLNKAMSRSRRNNSLVTLLFIDLDRFKPINDELGHDAGDVVLKEIAQRLKATVREVDTVARLGGDEFGIILEDIQDENRIEPIVAKVQKAIRKPVKQLKNRPYVTGSIGAAIYPLHASEKDYLIKCADLAMYKAKKSKNQWAMFSESLFKD